MKALPLLAILKIITTSRNFTQKKKKTPNQQTSKTNQRVIQDKLCILCMDLHNLPGRERGKKTFLEQAAFWHEVKVV